MWIYYYASFGPGHQSNDYGFRFFADDSEDEYIKEHLFGVIDSCGYDIVLKFWEVEILPAKQVERKTKGVKEEIKYRKKYLKMLESTYCFVSEEKEGEDPVLQNNIIHTVMHDLLRRLHKAGFMYEASDISNWRRGKKCLTGPSRSKILRIMRRSEKYPSAKEKLRT